MKSSQWLMKAAHVSFIDPDNIDWVQDTPRRTLNDYWGLLVASEDDLRRYCCGFDDNERVTALCLAAAIAESEGD